MTVLLDFGILFSRGSLAKSLKIVDSHKAETENGVAESHFAE